jgi:hypothetical protein
MRAAAWFRATGVVLVLFAAGHTFGFLKFRPATSDGLAVWDAMNAVHFAFGNSLRSYGELYRGFGLFITVFYLFEAWLAWSLGAMSRRSVGETERVAGALLALQIAGLGLSLEYFGAGPSSLSVVAIVGLAGGLWSLRSVRQRVTSAVVAV